MQIWRNVNYLDIDGPINFDSLTANEVSIEWKDTRCCFECKLLSASLQVTGACGKFLPQFERIGDDKDSIMRRNGAASRLLFLVQFMSFSITHLYNCSNWRGCDVGGWGLNPHLGLPIPPSWLNMDPYWYHYLVDPHLIFDNNSSTGASHI